MGQRVESECLDCGHAFSINHGGGFLFHQIRCEACGRAKNIGFDELGDLRLRYLQGLPESKRGARVDYDPDAQTHEPVTPISEDEYYRGVEAYAGKCKCDGNYTFDALPRCPKCRSTRLTDGDVTMCYD